MFLDPEVYSVFLHYLSERYLIWLRRHNGSPAPWTDDPILSTYKFTNVKREEDRTTRWLVENWYRPNSHQPLEVQALNCGIARYFGRVEFLEGLGYQQTWNPAFILEKARSRMRAKKPVFTGAYIITNQGMADPKEEVVVNCFLAPYRNELERLVRIARETRSWQSVAEGMKGLPGMGPFMTKEILLDWQLTPLLADAEDKLTWTPAGPGALRGLQRLAGAKGTSINRGMGQELALRQMKELLARLVEDRHHLPDSFPEPGVEFGVTDVQFCLCELDKYMRVRLGEGRPRSKFRPTPEKPV